MLEKRVTKLLQRANHPASFWERSFGGRTYGHLKKTHKADIRPRHPALLALEGWYESEVVVPEQYKRIHELHRESGSNVKLTRWALRNNLLNEVEASALGKNLDTTRFKISCRHNDLLRLADTHHYSSCMDGAFGQQQLQYLADPDVAVIYVPDASGKYSWRCLARLVMDEYEPGRFLKYIHEDQGYGLALYRVYGNGPTQAIYEALDKKVRVYQARDIRHGSVNEHIIKLSPTIHNNKFLSKPIWTDQKGVGWDYNRRMKIAVLPRSKDKISFLVQDVRYL